MANLYSLISINLIASNMLLMRVYHIGEKVSKRTALGLVLMILPSIYLSKDMNYYEEPIEKHVSWIVNCSVFAFALMSFPYTFSFINAGIMVDCLTVGYLCFWFNTMIGIFKPRHLSNSQH